ncbi:MAG: diaminopimelate decarboxylase [Candidatus Omnitrophota bacterium]
MHDFIRKGGKLYCEGMDLNRVAERFGTPLYVYSYNTLTDHFLKLREAFREIAPLICYSVKANSNLSILKILVEQGAGLDIVSGGELFRALKSGCPPERIVYASVGKTDREIEEAVSKKILFFNVESEPELARINLIAGRYSRRVKIALRINPDVEAKTHKFITTGKITNKFGVDLNTAGRVIRSRNKYRSLDICGLHMHIGSQITEGGPFLAAINKVAGFARGLASEAGAEIRYLNIGGGLGIIYDNENPQTALSFSRKVLPVLKSSGFRVIMEPGRFIVGNAGILIAKVLYVKKTPLKKFIIVDAGMNDLIRPALYGAFHKIEALKDRRGDAEKADVVGPICESGDFLAKARELPCFRQGDYLAVMSAGAYGFSMSSNYNSRLKAAEVMVRNNRVVLIRRRDDYADLVRNEIIA